ncbi:MAG: hypothetical protein OXU64_13750 [Gemmatimonadota bacterium]|nr:hypothetical protein [Gemmatimonadota bacterium]
MPKTRAEILDVLERLDECVADDLEGQHLDFKQWDQRSDRGALRQIASFPSPIRKTGAHRGARDRTRVTWQARDGGAGTWDRGKWDKSGRVGAFLVPIRAGSLEMYQQRMIP